MMFESGGGGMVSTMADYARLCLFWCNGGTLDGVRLVSRKTVELMTTNHLPASVRMGPDMTYFGAQLPSPEVGQGFGLGFAGAHGARPQPAAGQRGRLFMERHLRHLLLGGSEGGPVAILMMQSMAQRIPTAG